MTIQELGQTVQSKYPQYQGMDPAQVGQLVVTKYPQYQSQITAPQPQDGPQLHDTGSFLGNLGHSFGNFVGGIGNAIAHPIQTAENLGKVALGGVEKLIPGQQGAEQNFNQVLDYYKQRYGSVENFLKTAYQDPVGTAADASIVFGGAGAALKGAAGIATAADAADIAGGLSKAADIANTVSDVANPLNVITKPVGAALKGTANALSKEAETITNPPLKISQTALKNWTPEEIGQFQNIAMKDLAPGDRITKISDANAKVNTFENALQSNLTRIDAALPQDELISRLEDLKQVPQLRNDPRFPTYSKAIDDTINNIKNTQDPFINVGDLNMTKRGYNNAFRYNGEILRPLGAAIRGVYQRFIEDGLDFFSQHGMDANIQIPPELQPFFDGQASANIHDFNAAYASLLKTKSFLGQVGNVKPGLISQALEHGAVDVPAYLLGHAIGGPVVGLIGPYIGEKFLSAIQSPEGKQFVAGALNKTASVASNSAKIVSKANALTTPSRVSTALTHKSQPKPKPGTKPGGKQAKPILVRATLQ